VTCRGNAGQDIFLNNPDRLFFIELLGRSGEIYQIEILAFVLMNNHFHLIVKTPLANLQEFMRHFNISYTAYFNKKHGRAGHLYQGRYRSFIIDADSYLLEVSRYVHLNPVHTKERAASSPESNALYLKSYKWSSYSDYTGKTGHYPFLAVNEILGYFKGDKGQYAAFVEGGITGTKNPLEKGKGLGIVGDKHFIERIMKQTVGKLKANREQPATKRIIKHIETEKILRIIASYFDMPSDELLKKGASGLYRKIAMELLYRYAGMNGREIGALMGVDYSSVSVARKRLRAMLEADKDAARAIKEIKERLSQ